MKKLFFCALILTVFSFKSVKSSPNIPYSTSTDTKVILSLNSAVVTNQQRAKSFDISFFEIEEEEDELTALKKYVLKNNHSATCILLQSNFDCLLFFNKIFSNRNSNTSSRYLLCQVFRI